MPFNPHSLEPYSLDTRAVRDLAPQVLDASGRLRILPAEFWATTTVQERVALGHRHALYGLPTVELVAYLKDLIGGRPAIEIGSGNGVLAEALGITATDNRMQERPAVRRDLAAFGQPPVRYGDNVIECDARRAIRRFRPEVVVACWVTHKYDRARHWAGGNVWGVDEERLLDEVGAYVFVGNEQVHKNKVIWARPHTIEYPPFLYSRAHNGSRDFVAVWSGGDG